MSGDKLALIRPGASGHSVEGLDAVAEALAQAFPGERRHFERSDDPIRVSVLSGQIGGIHLVESTRHVHGWSRAPEAPGALEDLPLAVGFNLRHGIGMQLPNGESLHARQGRILVSRYDPANITRRDYGSAMLFLNFPPTLLADVLERHFHLEPVRPRFETRVLAGDHPIGALGRLACQAWRDLQGLPTSAATILAAQYQDTLATLLLLNLPHSLRPLLEASGQGGETRHLRRALEYMRAGLEEALTLPAIAAAAGCSPRQLQLLFRQQLDTTPMALLRQLRLEAADTRLRAGHYHNVTDAAYALGFSNLGRFAAAFRARFGYTPQQALLGRFI